MRIQQTNVPFVGNETKRNHCNESGSSARFDANALSLSFEHTMIRPNVKALYGEGEGGS